MSLYLYDKTTYEYKGTIEDNQVVPACCYATDIAPPDYGEFEIPVFIPYRNQWIIQPDYRGIWYNKTNPKEYIIIHYIGERIDASTYTNKKCPDPNFYVFDDKQNDWVFNLDLYKQYKIKLLLGDYYKYLQSRIPIFKLIGFTSLSLTTKIVIDSKTDLTEEQTNELADIVDHSINILLWVNKVTIYEDDIEKQIIAATTQEEVDNICDNVNFEQFDSELPDTTIVPSLRYLQSVLTTDTEESQ